MSEPNNIQAMIDSAMNFANDKINNVADVVETHAGVLEHHCSQIDNIAEVVESHADAIEELYSMLQEENVEEDVEDYGD